LGVVGGGVGYCGTAIECGHAVDDARVRLGAGFKWIAERKMNKGNVPAAARDGTALFKWTAVLGGDYRTTLHCLSWIMAGERITLP
jgi:hypothetical protein